MTEVAALSHLGRMQSRCRGELGGQSQRAEAVLLPEEVDVREDILLEGPHDPRRALSDRARWSRTGPEPHCGDCERQAEEGTAGHAPWIGRLSRRPVPRTRD